jgi:uncharacterized membrane protein YhaH (DUF805 family)
MLNHIKNLYKGRLGRLDYFTSPIAVSFILLAPTILFFGAYGIVRLITSMNGVDVEPLSGVGSFFSILAALYFIPAVVYYLIFLFSVVVRRGHDIEWSAGFSIFMYIIGQVIIVPLLFLLFQKSDKGENKYGTLPEGGYLYRVLGIKQIPKIVKYIYGIILVIILIVSAVLVGTVALSEPEYTSKTKAPIDIAKMIERRDLEPFYATLIKPAYMRQEPSTSSGIIRSYADTATVKVIGENENWYKIQAKDDWGNLLTGWMTKSAF